MQRHRWWPAISRRRCEVRHRLLSSTIDAVERLTRLNEDMTESRVLQHEILLLLPEAFERFKAICTIVQELYIYLLHSAGPTALGVNA